MNHVDEQNETEELEEASISLDLRRADAAGKIIGNYKMMAKGEGVGQTEPTHIRIVVRHLEDGFKRILDVEVPTDEVIQIHLPARNDYVVDAYSYKNIDLDNLLLKHDQKRNINLTVGVNTPVSLVLVPVESYFEIELPESVPSDLEFTVDVKDLQFTEYVQEEYFAMDRSIRVQASKSSDFYPTQNNYAHVYHEYDINVYKGTTSPFSFSKTSTSDEFIYFRVQRYISSYMLGRDEYGRFYYYYPPLDEDPLKVPFLLPAEESGMDLVIEY